MARFWALGARIVEGCTQGEPGEASQAQVQDMPSNARRAMHSMLQPYSARFVDWESLR